MARTSKPILLKHVDEYGKITEILAAETAFTLTYAGKPVALRETEHLVENTRIRYPRTGFNNLAHCKRLATRLNKIFNTDLFGVAFI